MSYHLREVTVYADPTFEIDYNKVEKTKGMNICFTTTAVNDEEGMALLKHLGMPFRQ